MALHLHALALQLILQELWVAVWPDRDRIRAPLRWIWWSHGRDGGSLVGGAKTSAKESRSKIGDDSLVATSEWRQVAKRGHCTSRAHRCQQHSATVAMESHAAAPKVPEDRTEGTQPSDAEHLIVSFEGDGIADNVEVVVLDLDGNAPGQTTTHDLQCGCP